MIYMSYLCSESANRLMGMLVMDSSRVNSIP